MAPTSNSPSFVTKFTPFLILSHTRSYTVQVRQFLPFVIIDNVKSDHLYVVPLTNDHNATRLRTVLQSGQDKTPKASPKKQSIMEYSPGLPPNSMFTGETSLIYQLM